MRGVSLEYDRYWTAMDAARARPRSLSRAALALDLLAGWQRGGGSPRLLDLGCGPGWALEAFASAGYVAEGVDASPRAVAAARARGLSAHSADVEENGALGAGFDVVVALEVLEHLRSPLDALAKMLAALRPGGRLVVSLPNEVHFLRRLSFLVGRPGFGGHDEPHLRFFTDASARRLFQAAGLVVLGARADSLVPPRWRRLRWAAAPLVRVLPGLFALAHVYLLASGPGEEAAGATREAPR